MRLIADLSTKVAISLAVVCSILTLIIHDNLQDCKECFRQFEVELNVTRVISSYSKRFCFYRHKPAHSVNVRNVLTNLGYKAAPDSPNWNVLFMWVKSEDMIHSEMIDVKPDQKFNWFMGVESQYYLIKLYLALVNRNESFIAPVFVLPNDKELLLNFLETNPNERVVSKNFHHRGIQIINSSLFHSMADKQFVQKFISNPLLVGGHKFELGIYVILTSVDPLRLYIYNGDISLRFCPKPYHPFDPDDLDKYVVADYYKPTWEMPELYKQYMAGFGQRISLITYFNSVGVDISPIWEQIEEIIVKIVLKTSPTGHAINNFVELQRCDFLIDENLNVFLLECNFLPNLGSVHFPQNQLLFEQIIYNVFSVGGIAVRYKKNTLALTSEESTILASDRDISVYPNACFSDECSNSCQNEICNLCQNCLSLKNKETFKKAYREHVNRMNCRRIWPPPMDILKQDPPENFRNLSKSNQMMYKWFLGKCLLDDTWCH